MTQVGKGNYVAGKYAKLDRFASYSYQIREILATKPHSILEVGIGDGVIASYMKTNTDITYTTADFAVDLKPDVVADVRELPFSDLSFDTVCAFEVLEHIPIEDLEKALRELARVARTYVIISLPHFSHPLKLSFKLPFVPEVQLAFRIPHSKRHVFDGQHYWEIGKRGYPASRIRSVIQKFGSLEREFVPFENQSHHFFVLNMAKKKLVQP